VHLRLAARFLSEPPAAAPRARTRADWPGIGLLVIGLGATQIVLDRGQRADWFAAAWVRVTTATAVLALVVFVVWELRTRDPVVQLRLLRDRAFAIGCSLIALLAFVLFGTLALWPLYLQNLMGYTAWQAGWTMAPRGLATASAMFLVGRLVRRVDPRVLIGGGVLLLFFAQIEMSRFYLQLGWWQLVAPSLVQGFGMGCIFTLLSTTSLARLRREQMTQAASIYNLLRNLGASFGIAILSTLLERREQFHQAVLSTWSSPLYPPFREALAAIPGAMAARGFVVDAAGALALLYAQLQSQAAMLAFEDAFLASGIVSLGILLGVAFMPYTRPARPDATMAH
jgi:DHA2 family multidrug resistance protein